MVDEKAFDGVIKSPLEGRIVKPRRQGQTMIIDKGLGLSQTGDLLELAADYIDYVKFTFGTAALYPPTLLRAKIALIRSYGINVYPGGTFLEIALTQDRLGQYLQRSKDLGFNYIEVSDGTISLSPVQRRRAIDRALACGFQVISEVGKKDGEADLDPDETVQQVHDDLAAGACKVIVEGRESGMGVGIFDGGGQVKDGYLDAIASGLHDPAAIMWEAPLKSQQEALIARFGPNVNLGNVPPADALALEALRQGLRGDTLRLALTFAEGRG